MAVRKVTYSLNLNDLGLDEVEAKEDALKEVAEYLRTEILDSVSNLRTTVKGGSYKTTLSPAYKKVKSEFSSSLVPNMELTGDMLDSLRYEINANQGTVEIGFFDFDEAQKADNHNKFSSESMGTDVPARQFIPKPGRDEFREDIIREVRSIISDYIVERPPEEDAFINGLVIGSIGSASLIDLTSTTRQPTTPQTRQIDFGDDFEGEE
jgi:hypothetical protein